MKTDRASGKIISDKDAHPDFPKSLKYPVLIAYSKSTRKLHLDHRMRLNGSANTLNTGDGCRSQSTMNYVLRADKRLYKLTPHECERLMGWRTAHTSTGIDEKGNLYEMTDAARYSMCGNGVISACVEPIVDLILENEERLKSKK